MEGIIFLFFLFEKKDKTHGYMGELGSEIIRQNHSPATAPEMLVGIS
jgi:hypothetical protein